MCLHRRINSWHTCCIIIYRLNLQLLYGETMNFNWLYSLCCMQNYVDDNLRFNCLNGAIVVEAKLSDHNPVLYVNAQGERFCCWNILTKKEKIYDATKNITYFNNGFAQEENNDQYWNRLKIIIKVLLELHRYHGVQFFCLQEVPPIKEFLAEISKHFQIHYNAIAAGYNGTKGVYPFGGELFFTTQKCTNVINTTNVMKNIVSTSNKDRFQSFTLNIIDKDILLANFHADFSNQQMIKEDIKQFVKLGYIVAGDFNIILDPELPYKEILHATEPNLFSGSHTFDGFIDGRYPIALRNRLLLSV